MLFFCLLIDFVVVTHESGVPCPPENSQVMAFRSMADVREPLHLPIANKIKQDMYWAKQEFLPLLKKIDIAWKVTVQMNGTSLNIPFLDQCCPQEKHHQCVYRNIVLQYVNFQGGVCWVVWPDAYYVYRRCTCCSCLLQGDSCPVVGVCVDSDYYTVIVIAYCPHIMYSDRWQRIAMRLPFNCRCQAACPIPEEYIEPFNSPAEEKALQKFSIGRQIGFNKDLYLGKK